jgi:5-methylcytosine-specific restriction protein A
LEKLPFIPGQIYTRSSIHDQYGGNRQSGICPTANFPYIFIFSGASGHQHGYVDGWITDDVFVYTGAGQFGDMTFSSGNLALKDHQTTGKRVFLFTTDKKRPGVLFEGELELISFDFEERPDSAGNRRRAINFLFKRKESKLYIPDLLKETPAIVSDPGAVYETKPNVTERKGLVTSRVGQGAYRKKVIVRWDCKCAVTGFDNLNVLIASHILPWSAASDEQRVDTNNGILLSPTYDALFDKHLISFENSGKIILSDSIKTEAFKKVGVTGNERIQNLSEYNHNYLDHHREHLR